MCKRFSSNRLLIGEFHRDTSRHIDFSSGRLAKALNNKRTKHQNLNKIRKKEGNIWDLPVQKSLELHV